MRRAPAVLAAVLALLVALAPTGSPAGGTAQQGEPAPILQLLSQPAVVEPDGDFGVLLSVAGAPEGTELAVYIYDRADAGDTIGVEPEEGPSATFPLVALPPVDPADPDAPRTSGFSIALYEPGQPNPDPAWGYRLDEPGVYPVRVRLRDADGDVLAVLMTSILRLPGADQQVATTEAALLVEGHRAPPTDGEARAASDAADASLVDELAPVLDELAERPAVPATFSLTPDAVARMAGDADGDAATVLADLRDLLAAPGHDLLDAPYVDLDPASLVSAGLASELGEQRDLGRQTLRDLLLEEPLTGTWQVESRLDVATLEALRQRGIFRLLVGGDVVADGAGVLGPTTLADDPSAAPVLAASPTYALGDEGGDAVLAGHRLLARLAAAATDRTEAARVVVDVAPAVADPASLAIVLDALDEGSALFRPATLDVLLDAPPATEARLAPADPPSLGRYPSELRAARSELASYASMVGDRAEQLAAPERSLALSAAAELDLAERRADVDGVRRELAEVFSSISLPEGDTVTLGAREGQFPLPIESELDEPVQVVIALEASDRLELPDDRIEATLDSERTVVEIDVKARASGDTPVRITVRSPDDGVVLSESRYVVRSTAVSGVGILLTVGAAGFLAIWWGRHWWRARRAHEV